LRPSSKFLHFRSSAAVQRQASLGQRPSKKPARLLEKFPYASKPVISGLIR
jgi:hypothetical protein